MGGRWSLPDLPVPVVGVHDQAGLAEVVVGALTEAHESLAAAQAVSGQPGQAVYAQIWRSLGPALAEKLAEQRPDVQLIRPGRAAYKVPVIGDVVLFPWRPAGGRGPTDVPFGTSPTRNLLWLVPPLPAMLGFVDDTDDGTLEEASTTAAAVVATQVFDEAARRHLRVVVAAMTSDAQRRHRIEWGEAELDQTGGLGWLSHQVLFEADPAATPTDTSPAAFDAGTPPTPGVRLKPAAVLSGAVGDE